MQTKKHLSTGQLLLSCCLLLVFTLLTIRLFTIHRDKNTFEALTEDLFRNDMTASTLSMHYNLADPSAFGITEYEARLPLYHPDSWEQEREGLTKTLQTLQNIDSSTLSDQDALLHKLLVRSLTVSEARSRYPFYQEPLSPASGAQSQIPILLAEYTFRTKRDVEDYLALLDQVDDYFASLLIFEQEKADAGLLQCSASLDKVIDQCDTIVTSDALSSGNHFLQTTFAERIGALTAEGILTADQQTEYLARNETLLKEVVLPAYETLADGLFVLRDKNIPLRGLAALPEGKEYYELLLTAQTGSGRSVSELKQLLTEQFQKDYQAIRTLVTEHPEIVTYLKSEEYKRFPLTSAEEMLTDLQTRMQNDFPPLTDASSLPPAVVKTVSPSLQKYCAPAFYLTAPVDDTDNNVIYINEKKPPSGLDLYTTLAHEGYPGHLYQTVYNNCRFLAAKENNARQTLWYGGYLEGWALYVEFIGYDYASALLQEQGCEQAALCYQLEKYNRSMQLCLYSLLDLMIHDENASFSQAAKLLKSCGIEAPASMKAIYTYITEEPCNYPKYYVGYLEILALKEKAAAQWKDSYSDLAFHTFFLDCGPCDFVTLEELLYEPSAGQ